MRTKFALVLTVVLASIPTLAQDAAQRDPQAVAVFNQTLIVTGWASPPSDAVARGTVTRFLGDGSETVSITLKASGANRLRTDLETKDGTVTTVRNGPVAAHKENGTEREVPGHAVSSLAAYHFPFFSALGNVTPNKGLVLAGVEQVNGEEAYRIEIQTAPDPERPNSPQDRAKSVAVLISTRTFLPLRIEYKRVSATDPNLLLACERYFSDFRRIGSILVPFAQDEFVFGRRTTELRLTSVQLNAGLSDNDFQVVAATEPE